jgi:hypothetical protein
MQRGKRERERERGLTAGGGELESAEADIVEGLVVKDHALVSVLDKLVDGEGGVVGLNDGVRDLGGWEHREGEHHSVRVLLPYLRYQ